MKIFSYLLCTAFLLIFSTSAHAQIITTVAGGDSVGLGDGGPANACELATPIGIVFDTAGNYYITDRDHNRIRMVTPAGIITTIAGTGSSGVGLGSIGDNGPATAASIWAPYGIAIDRAGNIYFADGGNERIRKINSAGIITTIAGNGTGSYNGDNIAATSAEIHGPGGVAVDNAGNVYFCDGINNRVRKINTVGIITTIAGTGVVGYNGDEIPATNALLHGPAYVALDTASNIYTADYDNNRIRKVDPAGIIHTIAGDSTYGYTGDNGPATAAKLSGPLGVYTDNLENIYIGDTYNNVVRKVNASGIITTIAGNGTEGFNGDGELSTIAELFYPVDIAMDAVGDIYIADSGNERIRRLISTVFVQQLEIKEELRIYPNPCDGSFTVNILTSRNEQAKITVTDITGRVIKEIHTVVNSLCAVHIDAPPGIYMLYAVTANGTLNQKIVKMN
jgi:sugar lactone lactonase YvrE